MFHQQLRSYGDLKTLVQQTGEAARLKISSNRLVKLGSNLQPLVYKAWGLSTIPQRASMKFVEFKLSGNQEDMF